MDELRRGEPYAVEFVPTDRMLLPPDREGMRRKASSCVECELIDEVDDGRRRYHGGALRRARPGRNPGPDFGDGGRRRGRRAVGRRVQAARVLERGAGLEVQGSFFLPASVSQLAWEPTDERSGSRPPPMNRRRAVSPQGLRPLVLAQ